MTSHIAYVIYAIITLITTQGLCNITFVSYVFLPFLMLWGPYFFYSLPFSLCLYPCRILTLYRIRNQVYLSTHNHSTLNAIDGFL